MTDAIRQSIILRCYRAATEIENVRHEIEAEQARPDLVAILERERTKVAEGVIAVQNALRAREWLTEGRGPYAYDDDRWRSEFAAAIEEIRMALKPLQKIAGDLTNCPTTQSGLAVARSLTDDEIENVRARYMDIRK